MSLMTKAHFGISPTWLTPTYNKAWPGDEKFAISLRDIILEKENTFLHGAHVSYAFNMLVEKFPINDETGSS